MTLSDLANAYVNDPRELNTPRSRATYSDCLRDFVTFVTTHGGDNSLRTFTPAYVEAYVAHLFGNGLKASTVNLRLSAVSGLAAWLMRRPAPRGKGYMLDSNPVIRIKRPKNNRPRVKFLSVDELRALLAVECKPNERLALELIIDQPLRATEYCEAKVSDLTLADGNVALQVRVKGGEYRTKVLGQRVAALLTTHLRQREAGPNETILLNTKGQPYTHQSLSEMLLKLARRASIHRIPVRSHVIRHSIASAAAALGATVHELADMLNHSDTNTVRRYVHGITQDAALTKVRALLDTPPTASTIPPFDPIPPLDPIAILEGRVQP